MVACDARRPLGVPLKALEYILEQVDELGPVGHVGTAAGVLVPDAMRSLLGRKAAAPPPSPTLLSAVDHVVRPQLEGLAMSYAEALAAGKVADGSFTAGPATVYVAVLPSASLRDLVASLRSLGFPANTCFYLQALGTGLAHAGDAGPPTARQWHAPAGWAPRLRGLVRACDRVVLVIDDVAHVAGPPAFRDAVWMAALFASADEVPVTVVMAPRDAAEAALLEPSERQDLIRHFGELALDGPRVTSRRDQEAAVALLGPRHLPARTKAARHVLLSHLASLGWRLVESIVRQPRPHVRPWTRARIAEQHAIVAGLERTLLLVEVDLGRGAMALDRARASAERAAALHGPGDERTLEAQTTLAAILAAHGREHAQAEDEMVALLEAIVAARRAQRPVDSTKLTGTLALLADALRDAGRFAEACPLFREALGLSESALGAEHVNTLLAHVALANCLRALRDDRTVGEAAVEYELAAEGLESVLGRVHPFTVAARTGRAALLLERAPRDSGFAEELAQLLEELVLDTETCYGSDHEAAHYARAKRAEFAAIYGSTAAQRRQGRKDMSSALRGLRTDAALPAVHPRVVEVKGALRRARRGPLGA